jgi:NAD-dependent dihydropyrimidine dehydrogenase PreA subunit
MVVDRDIYKRLSEKIGVVGYPRYIKILEQEMQPEEAQLAVDLADGLSNEELKKKFEIDAQTVEKRIADLLSRQFVRRSKEGKYAIPQMPRFFPRLNHTPELRQLWFDFFHSGDYVEIDVAHMKARHDKRPGLRSHKIIPARQAILASSRINKDQVLWYEDMEQIFRHSQAISQGGFNPDGTLRTRDGCGCRRYWGTCDSPGGCTGWSWKVGQWGQENPVGLPFGGRNQVTFDQALKACDQMEDYGLIHMSPNTAQITSTCNCCECCCEIIFGFKKLANIWELISPSRYRAVIDPEKCQGCQTCVERCHFDAIEMRKVEGSKKMKAFIVNEHCMGCGLCVFKCPNQALDFELVRPPSHIPTMTMGELFAGRI